MRFAVVGVVCALSGLLVAGCGSAENSRRAISGNVQVAGEALEAGMITFVPLSGTAAPAAATVVSGGRYRFTAANGPLPGEYTVRISSSAVAEPSSAASAPGAAPAVAATAPEASVQSKRGIAAVAGDSAASSSATAVAAPQPLQWESPVTVSADGSATKDFDF